MRDGSFDYTGCDGVQQSKLGSRYCVEEVREDPLTSTTVFCSCTGGKTNMYVRKKLDQNLYSWEVQVQALEVLQAKGRANSGHMFWGRSIVVT